jgi:hypothetical protein
MNARTWEELGDHAEDHRADAAEAGLPLPVWDTGQYVRILAAPRPTVVGWVGVITRIDSAYVDEDGQDWETTYQVTVPGQTYPGGWWLGESDLEHVDEEDVPPDVLAASTAGHVQVLDHNGVRVWSVLDEPEPPPSNAELGCNVAGHGDFAASALLRAIEANEYHVDQVLDDLADAGWVLVRSAPGSPVGEQRDA